MAIRHMYCVVMFSWGSENFCKDKCKNVKTSYSAYAALVQSFQAELTTIPKTLRGRYHEQFALDIPKCNDRACNLDDLYQPRTSLHEVDSALYLEVAAFGMGCQTEF
jgi:hypothetical protein